MNFLKQYLLTFSHRKLSYMKPLFNFLYLLLASASTGCLIYVVVWLEALRKGWLV